MAKQGGPAAAIAKQQLERMGGGAPAGVPGGASSGSLIEMTIDSSDFSSASLPDSTFTVPADFRKIN